MSRGGAITTEEAAGSLVAEDSATQLSINSTKVNAVQNTVNKELKLLTESVAGPHENVAFYWDQASNTTKSRATDKGKAVLEAKDMQAQAGIKALRDPPAGMVEGTNSAMQRKTCRSDIYAAIMSALGRC